MRTDLPHDVARAVHRLRLRTVKAVRETPDERKKLAKSLDAISKQYGEDVLAPIKQLEDRHDVPCVATGFQALDDVLSGRTERVNGSRKWVPGSGRGVPRARIVEVFGPESSGKTTLTLMLVRAFQERGLRCAFIDAEHALDMDYADNIGCDTENWYYSQGGESAEETLDIVNKLVKDDVMDLIVVDSVAALTPKAELEGDIGDKHIGLHARLMSQALRMITANLKRKSRATVVFINQTRMKIGVMFGNPETTTGGNALKFYASQRIRTSALGEIKKGGEKGIRVKVKLRKNKVAMPFGECFMEITGSNGVTAVYSSDPRSKSKDDDDDDTDD